MTEKLPADTKRDAWMLATLRTHPLLASLDDEAIGSMVAGGAHQVMRGKRTFLRDGDNADYVYFLLAGAVRVYHRGPAKAEVLLKLLRAPAMFGEIEIIARRPYVENVTTLEESQVLAVPAALFRVLLTRFPDFCSAVLDDVARRFCVTANNVKAIAFADVLGRLAALFLDYLDLGATTTPAGFVIDASVSQEHLARDLAVSRKAVQNALAILQRRGFVKKQAARYLVSKREGLESLAGFRAELAYSSRRRASSS